ncbi:MAG: DNA polymerase III subunit chi [Alphaproteobacteria bacterium]
MPEVWFYHLESSNLDAVLPGLLEKGLERGWRALVRTTSRERMRALDDILWSYRDDSFLAHGSADDPDTELQPVLISANDAEYDRRELLILIDQAEPGAIDAFERVILLFDGADEEALKAARTRWKEFSAQGVAVTYYQQNAQGRWEKKA